MEGVCWVTSLRRVTEGAVDARMEVTGLTGPNLCDIGGRAVCTGLAEGARRDTTEKVVNGLWASV